MISVTDSGNTPDCISVRLEQEGVSSLSLQFLRRTLEKIEAFIGVPGCFVSPVAIRFNSLRISRKFHPSLVSISTP